MCNDLKCKFCGSNRINKRGKQKYNGKQRYLCREARSQTMMCLSYRFAPIVLRQTLGLKPLVGDLK